MENKEFNQLEYIKEYTQTNYKQFKALLKPNEYNLIEQYLKENKYNKSDFLRLAIKKIIKNQEK